MRWSLPLVAVLVLAPIVSAESAWVEGVLRVSGGELVADTATLDSPAADVRITEASRVATATVHEVVHASKCVTQSSEACSPVGGPSTNESDAELAAPSAMTGPLQMTITDVVIVVTRADVEGASEGALITGVGSITGSGTLELLQGSLELVEGQVQLGDLWEEEPEGTWRYVTRSITLTGFLVFEGTLDVLVPPVVTGEAARVTMSGYSVEDTSFRIVDSRENALLIESDAAFAGVAPAPEPSAGAAGLVAGTLALVALAGAAGLAWPLLSFSLTAMALPMYSRISRSELLDHDARSNLVDAIQAQPGVHPHALAEDLGIGWGTVVYHLRLLEKNGVVVSRRAGRYRRYYPSGGYTEIHKMALAALQNDTSRAVAEYVLESPGITQTDLCGALNISPSLASWHIKRLVEADLVRKERDGRMVRYTPGNAWTDLSETSRATLASA